MKATSKIIRAISKNGAKRGMSNSHQLNSMRPIICNVTNMSVNNIPPIKCLTLTGIMSSIVISRCQ